MNYQHYTPEFKAKIVLEILQGEKNTWGRFSVLSAL